MSSFTTPQSFGVRELYRPTGSLPEVDIVAVHGLNGDRLRTWTTQTGRSSLCWLDHPDFLPKYLPQARVLTYGYNANIFSFGSKIAGSERLLQHAHTLVAQLTADRELENAAQRPIIFVCHSLGGIVVKRALVYSANQTSTQVTHLQSLYTCTYGILFLGTPHHGSSKAHILHTVTNLASLILPSAAISFSSTLLRSLESESEALQEATAAWIPLMSRFCIFFFWEQHMTDLKYKRDYIVDEASAAPILDNTERCGIAADHREMCRFATSDDQGFRTVIEALRRYARSAPSVVAERHEKARMVFANEMDRGAKEMRRQSSSSGLISNSRQERATGISSEQAVGSRDAKTENPSRPTSPVIKPQWQDE